MEGDYQEISSVAKELGYELVGIIPHVVGVSLKRREPWVPKLDIFVDIDSEVARTSVPHRFMGHNIYVRLVGTPEFA